MIRFTQQHNICDIPCGDKSISHRALMLAAIADGKCVLRNISLCQDVLSTVRCLQTLGAKVDVCGTTATVYPVSTPNSDVILDCGNSGTTARLLAGLVAGLGVHARFVGDKSLSARPMDRVVNPLRQLGANIRMGNGCMLEVFPSVLHGVDLSAQVNSAQVKSAVLLAGLFASGTTSYTETLSTRDHTENLLRLCRCQIVKEGLRTTVKSSRPHAFEMDVCNDFSSVSFGIVLSMLLGEEHTFTNVCVNPRRTGLLTILKNSGANLVLSNLHTEFGEQIADIRVLKGTFEPLYANESQVCDAIDELPIAVALALAIKGRHRFCNVSELQFKESNRLRQLLNTAQICHQKAIFDGRDLVVESNGVLPHNPCFCAAGDHRISMSQAVLCLAVGGGTVMEENFDVSFPDFLKFVGVVPANFALVGSDVSCSLSPCLVAHLAGQSNICCRYNLCQLPQDVSDQALLDTINAFDGVNVTMPFKRRVARLLGGEDSVNTVGGFGATSTDGYGVVQSLLDNGVQFENKQLWIVGAGGAAEAAVKALLPFGCKLQIVNRTQSHADLLTEKYNLSKDVQSPYGILSFVPPCELEHNLSIPAEVKFVFCANYLGRSPLKSRADKLGITYVDGLQMLYNQGAQSFALWTNTAVQHKYKQFLTEVKNEDTFA